jgi:hypothetical protein
VQDILQTVSRIFDPARGLLGFAFCFQFDISCNLTGDRFSRQAWPATHAL